MRWEDERYVRLYTRDTTTWKMLPWQSKALLPLIVRKVDRAGVIDLSGEGAEEAVAALTDMPVEFVGQGLPELTKRGVVVITATALVMPKYVEAQEAIQSDKARQQKSRETARDLARAVQSGLVTGGHAVSRETTNRDETSRGVTDGHEAGQNVTGGHAVSRAVTPSLAVPSRAEPNQPIQPNQLQQLLPRVVEKPDTPEEDWLFLHFEWWFQFKRQEAGLVPERNINPSKGGQWWSAVKSTPGVTIGRLKRAVYRFGSDPYWKGQGLPLLGFMSQWDKFLNQEVAGAHAG